MDPVTLTTLIKLLQRAAGLAITYLIGYLTYQNRRKDKRIDDLDQSLQSEINNIRIEQTKLKAIETNYRLLREEVNKIPIIDQRLIALENVYNVLNEINKNITEMSADIRVIKSNYTHVYKELERLDKDITDVRHDLKGATGMHRRKDDPQ